MTYVFYKRHELTIMLIKLTKCIEKKRRFYGLLEIFINKILTTILLSKKTKKITKKELYAQIVAKGVDKKIADSLLRANIDTIKFVNDLI